MRRPPGSGACGSGARKSLIDYLRQRLALQVAGHGASEEEIEQARVILDPTR